MNGQAVRERAAEMRKWRKEVAEEVSLYRDRDGVELLDSWIRNIQQDIEHKRRELWGDVVELNRLRAYRRRLANMPGCRCATGTTARTAHHAN